ncbi:MAG TPA: hypothetical protein VNN80_35855 [Polyangiaceae bacterium]|nr:hypothetical protein [Polyangiaceae bacterium]
MPISALVITLRRNVCAGGEREPVLAGIAREACLELGKPEGARVPAVCETPTLEEGRRLVERLMSMEGVANVDVLSVDFEDLHFEDA